jgi:hypothetical protein
MRYLDGDECPHHSNKPCLLDRCRESHNFLKNSMRALIGPGMRKRRSMIHHLHSHLQNKNGRQPIQSQKKKFQLQMYCYWTRTGNFSRWPGNSQNRQRSRWIRKGQSRSRRIQVLCRWWYESKWMRSKRGGAQSFEKNGSYLPLRDLGGFVRNHGGKR